MRALKVFLYNLLLENKIVVFRTGYLQSYAFRIQYSLSLDITFITCLTFKHFIVVFEPLQPQGVKFSVKFLYSLQIFYVADFNTYV